MDNFQKVQMAEGLNRLAGNMHNKTWRDIKVENRKTLRTVLLVKHGSITDAAVRLNVSYQVFSDTIGGRRYVSSIVAKIQADLELTNEQVLALWPLLKSWPREAKAG